jgi:hypothetical protein
MVQNQRWVDTMAKNIWRNNDFENLNNHRPTVFSAFGMSAGNPSRSFWKLHFCALFIFHTGTRGSIYFPLVPCFVLLHDTLYEASLSCLQRFVLRKIEATLHVSLP